MKIQTERNEKFTEVRNLVIQIGEVDFRISVSQFGDLVVNKQQNGEGSASISIEPCTGNEVKIK
jgi:hypothetical protein